MLRVDLSEDSKEIKVSGPGFKELRARTPLTYLTVIRGFRESGDQGLELTRERQALPDLVDLLGFLRKNEIRFRLSRRAFDAISDWRSYLNEYQKAFDAGREIKSSDQVGVELPNSFVRSLKPFQLTSVAHLLELSHGANFSVPGSGKTTIVLAAHAVLKEAGRIDKLFVVGPRSSFDPWEEEFEACFGRRPRSARISGPPEQREDMLISAEPYELFLATYQMLVNESRRIEQLLRRYRFFLVFDESHHLKKGEGGVWFEAARSLAPASEKRAILTGTPAPNQIIDLKAQFEILWPAVNELSSRLIAWETTDQALSKVRELVQPLYVRIKKSELDLPPKTVHRIPVEMGPVQKKIYEALTARTLSEIVKDPEVRYFVRDLRRSIIVRLIQAASNPALLGKASDEFRLPPVSSVDVAVDSLIRRYPRYEEPPKFKKAAELAQEIVSNGSKVIVWTSFVQNVESFSATLEKYSISSVSITGSVARDATEDEEYNRELLIRRFKTDSSVDALVATTFSIAESVSLHKVCKDAIYMDRTFNAGVHMQSMDRIHRIGIPRDDNINYHVLTSSGTIDEVIDVRLGVKMENMHRLLNDDIGILNLDVPVDLSRDGIDNGDLKAAADHLLHKGGITG